MLKDCESSDIKILNFTMSKHNKSHQMITKPVILVFVKSANNKSWWEALQVLIEKRKQSEI